MPGTPEPDRETTDTVAKYLTTVYALLTREPESEFLLALASRLERGRPLTPEQVKALNSRR